MMHWLDAHTHLDSDELFPQKENVLDRAWNAGVKNIVLVNSEASEISFSRTLECLSIPHALQRFACFGVHPHQAVRYDPEMRKRLSELLHHPRVIGFGEIGLDFFYNFSPQDVQISAFRQQLEFALDEGLPVVIHCRDAYPQLAEILKEVCGSWNGMIHCFTGTTEEMEPLLDLGFYISFSGIVTFRNATTVQESARVVPLERLLVETDAPFLAPVPYRGKTNEPAFVIHTAKFVATLKRLSEEQLSFAINTNFDRVFHRKQTKT